MVCMRGLAVGVFISFSVTLCSIGATRDYADPPCIGTGCCKREEGTNTLIWSCFHAYPICFQSVIIAVTCYDYETRTPFRVEFNFSKKRISTVLSCINFNTVVKGQTGCTWGDSDPCSLVCSVRAGLDFVDAFCSNYREHGCNCDAVIGPACVLLNHPPVYVET
jgi:hypothetical protein